MSFLREVYVYNEYLTTTLNFHYVNNFISINSYADWILAANTTA